MKILILGGSGFIGNNLIRELLQKYPGYEITNLDKLTYQKDSDSLDEVAKKKKYHFVEGDLRNQKMLDPLIKEADAVINLATSIDYDEQGEFLTTDMVGAFSVLESIKRNKVSRYLHFSDYAVYGDSTVEDISAKLFTETDPLNPKTPKAASKAGSDRLAFSYFLTYKIPVTILRTTNCFGPFQFPSKLIPFFIIQALEGKKLPIHGEGRHIRDWLYIKDLVSAVDTVIHNKSSIGEVYNIGASCQKSILEITELILAIMDRSKDLIDFVKEPVGHTEKRAVDVSKIKESLKWQAEWDFNKALEETIEWYIKNHRWWEKLI